MIDLLGRLHGMPRRRCLLAVQRSAAIFASSEIVDVSQLDRVVLFPAHRIRLNRGRPSPSASCTNIFSGVRTIEQADQSRRRLFDALAGWLLRY